MERSRGISDEELFMSKPAQEGDSPTVEPLRIFKPASPKPASDKKKTQSSSSSKPQPSFALPPGASSSANLLPYPDDDDTRFTRPTRTQTTPYPDDGPRVTSRLDNRQKRSGSESYNDTSPRITTSPTDKLRPGLAERRGTAPQPLSPPNSPPGEHDGLFAKPIREPQRPAAAGASKPASTSSIPSYANKKAYYPPPVSAVSSKPQAPRRDPDEDTYKMPVDDGVNRFPSTASNSTTRASRGSPPPPETPVDVPPGGGIEARYAAAGISGTATLNAFNAPSAAATQRLAQYGAPPPAQAQPTPVRPWTPTEVPGNPHGPPTVYQGMQVVGSGSSNTSSPPTSQAAAAPTIQVSTIEQDFQRMHMSPSPPPAYSSVNPNGPSGFPQEKQRPSQQTAAAAVAPAQPAAAAAQQAKPAPATTAAAAVAPGAATAAVAHQNAGHPAFANDPKPAQAGPSAGAHTPPFGGQTSPPPLPEGWISHLDPNSGQYYYIHLATQATQWEFPKGPNPIHHEPTPLSPTASTYGNPVGSPSLFGKQPMASPFLAPQTPGYAESIMSVATGATGFTGPPPSAGVEMYKIAPTNNVYFGPYLRYVNMDVEKGTWYGSIMIVTDSPQPPTIHIHLSVDLSANPRQLQARPIHTHQRWTFYKYDIDLRMGEMGTERWTYAVTSHLGCTRYEFVVAGRQELGWRFIAHSGNDFSPATAQAERTRLGGPGLMWKDVLARNVECGGFHVQLGLGDQIYGDRLWKEVPLLKQWLGMSGRENRKNAQWTARHEEDVSHAYFHYYTSHFDQPYLREAFAQIPHILQIDDHDM